MDLMLPSVGAFFLFGLAVLLVQALILYLVIVLAVRPSYREKQLNRQIDLLVEIARAQGVAEERIERIFK